MGTEMPPLMNLSEIIRAVHPMSDAGIALLEEQVESVHFKKSDILIREGKVCDKIFLIRSGILRNFANDENGGEDTRWFAYAGDPIASMFSLSEKLPAIASVETLTDCDAYAVKSEILFTLIKSSHEWAEWVSYLLIDGLYVFERRYTFLGRGDALTRYTNFMKMRPKWMVNCIPLKYIASYLGITPQTLSNIRRKIR